MRSIATAVLVLALVSGVAVAQESEQDRRDRSMALMREGKARYDVGKFDDATDLFEKAYEIWPYPEALFALCQSHRQLKHYERAIFFCKSFLRNQPNAPNRSDVEDRIVEMQDLLDKEKAAGEKPPEGVVPGRQTTASPPRPEPRPEPRWYHDKWGWAIAGSGALVAGVGAGFLVSAHNLDGQAGDETDQERRRDLLDDADTRRTAGTWVTFAGVAVVTVGVVKLVSAPATGRTALVLAPPGAGSFSIGLWGTF